MSAQPGPETAGQGGSPWTLSQGPRRCFKTPPEIMQPNVLMYFRFPLSLRNVEDLMHERGIDLCHESVHLWGEFFSTHFVHKIRKWITGAMRRVNQWRWEFLGSRAPKSAPKRAQLAGFKSLGDAALRDWRKLLFV